jgi:hypothetical protein
MSGTTAETATGNPWFEIEMAGSVFKARWRTCSDTANLVAQALSLGSPDSQQYTSLVSSITNELFELAHRTGTSAGTVRVKASAPGGGIRFHLEFDAGDNAVRITSEVAQARVAGMTQYLQMLGREETAPTLLMLMELTVVHNVSLTVRELGEERIELNASLNRVTGEEK